MFFNSLPKKNIAVFLALLFHISGFIGIVFTPYKDWFIQNTPTNLLLMFALLIWVQEQKNVAFYAFVFIACITGISTEMIGVNTAKLFGHYAYTPIMGRQINGVPFLIGINWFVVVFCSGIMVYQFSLWAEEKYAIANVRLPLWLKTASFVFDAAMLTTFFDFILEPIAIKLNFWQWQNNQIPVYNYICWFVISAVLLFIFKRLSFNKHNQFAIHLFIIQVLFFVALQIYL